MLGGGAPEGGHNGGMSVSLGMPPLPPPVLAPRRQTRQIHVGKVGVGSDFPVSVQSMTTTPTTDINATLQQIAELTACGCDIVRVAVPEPGRRRRAARRSRGKSQIPVIADIHFQPKYVYAAIEAGCAAVRAQNAPQPAWRLSCGRRSSSSARDRAGAAPRRRPASRTSCGHFRTTARLQFRLA